MKKNQIRKRVAALAAGIRHGPEPVRLRQQVCLLYRSGVSGEFTGTAKGMGGDVTVTLTLDRRQDHRLHR